MNTKKGTTRKWKEQTLKQMKKAMKNNELVRGQTNWGHDSLFCYVRLLELVSGPANKIVTDHVAEVCSGGSMSRKEYMERYFGGLEYENIVFIRLETEDFTGGFNGPHPLDENTLSTLLRAAEPIYRSWLSGNPPEKTGGEYWSRDRNMHWLPSKAARKKFG